MLESLIHDLQWQQVILHLAESSLCLCDPLAQLLKILPNKGDIHFHLLHVRVLWQLEIASKTFVVSALAESLVEGTEAPSSLVVSLFVLEFV